MRVELSHRHGHEHEHEVEPQYGLPEKLPQNERILWQGSPDWKILARFCFHTHKLAAYFAALIAIRVAVVLTEGGSLNLAMVNALWLSLLAAIAIGIMAGIAYLCARTTVYTITTHRVVMRVGIVLRLAFNLPFKRIASAGFRGLAGDRGDIPLALMGDDRIAYLNLWPHARPWRFSKPEPMLRSVPKAQEVARILSQAWSQRVGQAATVALPRAVPTRTADAACAKNPSPHPNHMGMA